MCWHLINAHIFFGILVMNSDEINKDMVLELFYSTKGDIDKINQAIDAKLKSMRVRKIC